MTDIEKLEPRQIYRYFEDLAAIPHGSGNTGAIAAYCLNFAEKHGLSASQDNYGNVVICKPGTAGYEDHETIILQGHMDMVCEKKTGCPKDMSAEGLTLCTDGDWLWADGTTLGADDGIAVAYILAILADEGSISHPPLEALFTCDEEIGMLGARALEPSLIRGRTMINIDSEKEGVITVSCAGGVRAYAEYQLETEAAAGGETGGFGQAAEAAGGEAAPGGVCPGIGVKITVDGLKGGHSGMEIHKHRTNAHVLLARILQQLSDRLKGKGFILQVTSMAGGNKTNVIPKAAEAVCYVQKVGKNGHEEELEDVGTVLREELEGIGVLLREELAAAEPDLQITITGTAAPETALTIPETAHLLFVLWQIPDGLVEMNPLVPDMTLTSLNMGEMYLTDGRLHLGYLIRSNGACGKKQVVEKLQNFVTYTGGSLNLESDYPVWPYMSVSPLRDRAVEAYRDLFDRDPVIEAVHAGLECGILAGKLGEMDMISIGPTLEHVHTPGERMNIDAAGKCWELLLEILRRS